MIIILTILMMIIIIIVIIRGSAPHPPERDSGVAAGPRKGANIYYIPCTIYYLLHTIYYILYTILYYTIVFGKGQMRSALMGSLQISYVLTEGLFGYSR